MVIGIKHLETLLATNCQLQFFWSMCFAESWTFCQKALSDVYAAHWQKKRKRKKCMSLLSWNFALFFELLGRLSICIPDLQVSDYLSVWINSWKLKFWMISPCVLHSVREVRMCLGIGNTFPAYGQIFQQMGPICYYSKWLNTLC